MICHIVITFTFLFAEEHFEAQNGFEIRTLSLRKK